MIVSQSAFRAEADSDHDSELSSGKFRSNRYLLAKPRTCTSLTPAWASLMLKDRERCGGARARKKFLSVRCLGHQDICENIQI